MKLTDWLYGSFNVEPVLEDLILSDAVQRLKGVYQGGASVWVNEKWNVTRYGHSIGVMLLIRKMGGSLKEQIAGLLHDVSHTAFSHVVDAALENQEENYHEAIFSDYIKKTSIPAILRKYQFDPHDVLGDDSRWSILERPAPELCADRVDYTLRDMTVYSIISLEEAHSFLESLIIHEGKMTLKNVESAEWFVRTYYQEVIGFFMNPLNVYGNTLLAEILKKALGKQILSRSDLLGTDEEVMGILKQSSDSEIKALLGRLRRDVRIVTGNKGGGFHQKMKLRLIDPPVLVNGKAVPASSLSSNVKEIKQKTREKAIEGVSVNVTSAG
ncbi:HD domain-containing protein [Jeotgalibacillus proteolyticus]|uniref:HD/PDEase domain-containing protein n=1 Tax=Jeotgalibacillus proteolyticus TaxID=2082395 RepID=A0A2S5GDC9_9BACL|nr:HD domain-containing protein [Jeotgalibacillus proteolyticus]PPA71010.1 hypothetical protein C4B60_09525 [Jeotgalibacillus proteolyticus]